MSYSSAISEVATYPHPSVSLVISDFKLIIDPLDAPLLTLNCQYMLLDSSGQPMCQMRESLTQSQYVSWTGSDSPYLIQCIATNLSLTLV